MRLKRFLVPALLSVSMLMASCSYNQNAAGSAPAAESEAGQEYRWNSESTEIEYKDGSLQPLCNTEAGFYALSEVKTGELIPEDVLEEAEKNGEEVINDGRYDVYEQRIIFISFEGEASSLEKYARLPAEKNTGGWDDFSSTSGLDSLALNEEGELYALEHTYASGYSEAGEDEESDADGMAARFEEKWYLRRLDPSTGRILSKKEIINEDGAFFSGEGMTFIDGKLWLAGTRDGGGILTALNTDGTIEQSISYEGYIYRVFTLNDGSPAILGSGSGDTMYVCAVDTESFSLKKLYEISESIGNVSSGSGEFSFYYTSGLYFCGWDGEAEQRLFSWTEVNVNSERISSDVIVNREGAARFIMAESGGVSSLFAVAKVPCDSEKERKTITLASSNADYCLKDAVADFNRSGDEYQLVITDDFDSADIIDLTGLDYRKLASQGRLADLYPYIDSDSGISREDFFDNILLSLEVNGKMCMSFSSFSIDTVLGAASAVGEKNSWTYEQYEAVADSLQNGSRTFDAYTTGYDILETCISMDTGRYIDWSSGTCSFESEEFEKLLEFAYSVQETCNGDAYDEDYSPDLEIYEGRQLLQRTALYDFDDAQSAGYEFGREVSYIGYPGFDGPGSALTLMSLDSGANFAISENSPDKDGAWQFIRTFFTEEYQSGMSCFPARIGLFNDRMEEAVKVEYILDKDGSPKLNRDTGEPVIMAAGTMYLSNFREIKYYPLTRTEADKFSALVTGTKNIMFRNEELIKIIDSAVKPYFEGSAGAHAAAASVQDAVSSRMAKQ